jgi:sugar phosphate isomerase/epimerase
MRTDVTRRDLVKASMAAIPAVALAAEATNDRVAGFKLGIITDEISSDLEEALKFISSYGLHYCELREFWGKNVMNSPQEDLDHAKKLLAQYNIQVSDIGSPIFKWDLPGAPGKNENERATSKSTYSEADSDKMLEQSFKIAHHFDSHKVRIFSYWRVEDPGKVFTQVSERLAKAAKLAAKLAAKNDIILVLENEYSCNVGSGKELGKLIKHVNSPNLRGVWDPGNAAFLGETPFPDGYEACKGTFAHLHIKDAATNPQTGKHAWMAVGGGTIDFKGQFAALHKDGYSNTMSLETHYRRPDGNKMESTRESLEGLLKVI